MSEPRLVRLAESGSLPDFLVRAGIRGICRRRLQSQRKRGAKGRREAFSAFVDELRHSPLAIHTEAANRQHYELPPEFFQLVLGPRLKYSCCLFPTGEESLEAAEEAMLRLTVERAALEDGMEVLDLGCGWGSFALWAASAFPRSRVTAVSNSRLQRRFIEERCGELGLSNVETITADICDFEPGRTFDRIVSIEMFEHLRNYEILFERLARWLRPGGRLFVHIFCHRELAYPYSGDNRFDWMGRHFFTGGIMPSSNLLLHFQKDLAVEEQWQVPGRHYRLTAEHWLKNLDGSRGPLLKVLSDTYGKDDASLWLRRWRIFFMACAELFGLSEGREWFVSHYRFSR